MATHDNRAASSPVAQLVLIKSPYLQLPHPVALPYNYTPLPTSVDSIVFCLTEESANDKPSTDFSQLLTSVELSVKKITALKAEHEAHLERIKAWEEQIREREVREKRRIAPGYLDTDQRLLVPIRIESPRVDSPATQTDGEDTTNQLGRTLGNLAI